MLRTTAQKGKYPSSEDLNQLESEFVLNAIDCEVKTKQLLSL